MPARAIKDVLAHVLSRECSGQCLKADSKQKCPFACRQTNFCVSSYLELRFFSYSVSVATKLLYRPDRWVQLRYQRDDL